jgi:hypothetical protein
VDRSTTCRGGVPIERGNLVENLWIIETPWQNAVEVEVDEAIAVRDVPIDIWKQRLRLRLEPGLGFSVK